MIISILQMVEVREGYTGRLVPEQLKLSPLYKPSFWHHTGSIHHLQEHNNKQ